MLHTVSAGTFVPSERELPYPQTTSFKRFLPTTPAVQDPNCKDKFASIKM